MLLLVAMLATGAATQGPAADSRVPLELSIVVSRRPDAGEAFSTGYTLHLLSGPGAATELRTGREVAVPVGRDEAASFQYRNVGTNLSFRAFAHGEDRFRIQLSLERSSLAGEGEPPSFHTFSCQTEVLLGDGESAEVIAGTDPMTGDRWSVEIALQR